MVYTYDPLNRLTGGTSSMGYSETGIAYDNLGNITSLTRGANTGGYSYTGNLLQTVSGVTTSTYTYDANGNVNHDGRTGATVTYNLLNLPQTVVATTPAAVNITYTYDAGGQKLRKVSAGISTDYISGIQYKSDAATIDFVQTEEGRAFNSGGTYTYEYTLTDHLGNNRITFDETTGKVGEDDYYPFGLNVHRLQNAGNKYLYNKKELQEEITEYDYGARFYDPVVARWTTVDPLAEISRRWSPYSYADNNPIRFIDQDGMWTDVPGGGITSDSPEEAKSFLKQQQGGDKGKKKADNNNKDAKKEKGVDVAGIAVGVIKKYTPAFEVENEDVDPESKELSMLLTGFIASLDLDYQIVKNYILPSKKRDNDAVPEGFKETKEFGKQHGQKVYRKGNKYYSRDVDEHNGGKWKVFEKQGGKL